MNFSVFPLAIKVENLKNFPLKDENLVSFKNISLDVPFWSLFSSNKKVNLNIHNPRILLNEKILSKSEKGSSKKIPIEIDRINIIDGELIYNTSGLVVNLLKFNLSSYTRAGQTMYKLNSPHLKIVFPENGNVDLLQFSSYDEEAVRKKIIKIEGNMDCEVKAQRSSWRISSFVWNTTDFRVDVNGRIFKDGALALNASIQGTPDKIIYPILKEFCPLGYMEAHAKINRKKKENLYIQAELEYNHFFLEKEEFENLKGTVDWNSLTKRILVNTQFEDQERPVHLKVDSLHGRTRVEGGGLQTQHVTRLIAIDDVAPLGNIIRQGDVTIENGLFSGTVTFAQQTLPTPNDRRFNVAGTATFLYNTHSKYIHFSAPEIVTEFGVVSPLEGTLAASKETNLALKAKAIVNDMAGINKYTNHYIALDLNRWKLKKGTGTINLDLKKINKEFVEDTDIEIHNFSTCEQPIETLSGQISTREGLTSGDFIVKDRDVEGKTKLSVSKGYFSLDFKDFKAEARKIFKILEIDLSLVGRVNGEFSLYKKNGEPLPLVKGNFQAGYIDFYGFHFNDVKGDLEFQRAITLKDLSFSFKEGKGAAGIFIDFTDKKYDVEGKIGGVDINLLNPEFNGRLNLAFKGKGAFNRNPITLDFNSDAIRFYQDRTFSIKGTGKIFTNFSNFRVETKGEITNELSVSPFTVRMAQESKAYSGSFHLSLTDINMLIPWGNNIGVMELDGQIIGGGGNPLTVEGHAEFKGRILSFPNFPHALENFEGDAIFKDLHFTLRSLKGTMGGGKVETNGHLYIENNKLTDLSLSLVGKRMNVYIIDRTNFLMNADLNLKYASGKLLLSGRMEALSGIWKREVDEGISFNTDPSLSPSGSKVMDLLEYDLKLTSEENILMENSFGNIIGKFDLLLTGSKSFPMLTGAVECHKGKINFSDKKFDLIKARMVFSNKFIIDPLVNIESETFIKDYRIKFNIKGTPSRLKPELQSTPPLPPRDILTLISLGELFERPTSTELSSQIGTGTSGLLASGLTEEIKKRTKKIFGNYMLKVDPNISNIAGASFEDTSRLIVGKEITKDFLVVYATNFSTKRRQVIYLQYQLSPSVSLIGMRNEDRQFSLDLRFRKRH
ncbi:MAG: hypothetical protein QG657_2360 [Acidobacteriota bacterium]|nr:hypothetical protein [Acidobacteriota bacterium]